MSFLLSCREFRSLDSAENETITIVYHPRANKYTAGQKKLYKLLFHIPSGYGTFIIVHPLNSLPTVDAHELRFIVGVLNFCKYTLLDNDKVRTLPLFVDTRFVVDTGPGAVGHESET